MSVNTVRRRIRALARELRARDAAGRLDDTARATGFDAALALVDELRDEDLEQPGAVLHAPGSRVMLMLPVLEAIGVGVE